MKQQKAKTYGKDTIKDTSGLWYLSKKYDGHQVFIKKVGTTVVFTTSAGKPFDIESIRKDLQSIEGDFILVGEYLYNCEGKLGSRGLSAKLTTFRTNYSKGIRNYKPDELLSNIMVFDCIPIKNGELITHTIFSDRVRFLKSLRLPMGLERVDFTLTTFGEALKIVKQWTNCGYEGGMLQRTNTFYYPGKRVHHAVKIKPRKTADLLCIGVEQGQGKYKDLIGALTLEDSQGVIVSVGSGLTDEQRTKGANSFLNKVIEIEYERIDTTYIQPTFKCVRLDKDIGDID